MEDRLAPHVDQQWAQEFIVTLRARGVSGVDIGSALAEVEAHVSESGQEALTVFGPAETYAQSLKLPVSPAQDPAEVAKAVAAVVIQLAGMMVILSTLPWEREPVNLTAGMLASVAAVLAFVILAAVWVARALPAMARHPWRTALLGVAYALVVIATSAVLGRALSGVVVMTSPRALVMSVGVAVLLAGVGAERAFLGGEKNADPVVGPLHDAGPAARSAARAATWSGLFIPSVTLVCAIVVQLLG